MCVTNTTGRRAPPQQPVSLGASAHLSIRERLFQPSAASSEAFPLFASGESYEYVGAPAEKPRPKRRRKPQKPGKTAKLNDRHFVVHNYHDHSADAKAAVEGERRKGGVSVPFPVKLHSVLDQVEADGLAHIVSWQTHGRCFVIHKPKEFVDHVMPKYFRQTKLTSFQRQLNLYGFSRLTRGSDATGYYHELFLRGKVFLCKQMARTKVKGTKFKAASSPGQEPDFYAMPPLSSNQVTSDEDMSHDSEPTHYTDATAQHQQSVAMNPFEPIPFEYALQQQHVPRYVGQAQHCDRVLDEAVEELFMDMPVVAGSSPVEDPMFDFVQDWVPQDLQFAESLENDAALGFMLEKLLEE